MARSVLANGEPIRRSQIREYRRRGAKLSGSHHDVIGRPRQHVLRAKLQRRISLKTQNS